jgi:hypothetical protein
LLYRQSDTRQQLQPGRPQLVADPPNTYAQPLQDQRQKVLSFNIPPGYQRTIDSRTLFTVNAYVRRDQVDYHPSRDPFDNSPATLTQSRALLNYGAHAYLSRVDGKHNWKIGINAMQTRLGEQFALGVASPGAMTAVWL